jgi:chaperonin GroES
VSKAGTPPADSASGSSPGRERIRIRDRGLEIRSRRLQHHRSRLDGVGRTKEGDISMKVRPLQDRIIVKRVEGEEKSKGGIIIPDTAKEKPQEGKVVAVGKGKVTDDGKLQPLDVKKGDRVLFSKYAGTEINIDGEEHLIVREDDVLGILE